MAEIRVIALSTETAQKVLATMKSPGYGHPAYTEVATGYGPCRHCLKTFRVGQERRTLFTCDPFFRVGRIPQPGPVFIHTELCERFDEAGGYPKEMLAYPSVMDGYDAEQRLVVQRTAAAGNHEAVLEEICFETSRCGMCWYGILRRGVLIFVLRGPKPMPNP